MMWRESRCLESRVTRYVSHVARLIVPGTFIYTFTVYFADKRGIVIKNYHEVYRARNKIANVVESAGDNCERNYESTGRRTSGAKSYEKGESEKNRNRRFGNVDEKVVRCVARRGE